MEKKQIILCASWLTAYFFAYSMDPASIFSYEQFRITRPYGILKSNFSGLPPDIIQNHIKPYIAQTLAIKYKHMILKYNDLRKSQRKNDGILPIISLGTQDTKTFRNHDGTYIIVPDIGYEYAMCDESLHKQYIYIAHPEDKDDFLKQILHSKKKQQSCIKVYCPGKKLALGQNTDLYIQTSYLNDKIHVRSNSIINRATLSPNNKWLMLATLHHDNNIQLVNLRTLIIEPISIHEGAINAVCSAHHSSKFIACAQNGNIYLITPKKMSLLPKTEEQTNSFICSAQFSPNDKQLITYGSHVLKIWRFIKNSKKNISYEYECITKENTIRKALFTPDGKIIIVAIKNGYFDFYDSATGNCLESYYPMWRLKSSIHFDKKPPLIICSTHSKLLISLDPMQSMYDHGYTFVIRKASGKFDFLAAHNFYPKNPVTMGLTKNEQFITFIDNNDHMSLLNLYDEQAINCIDFIERTADLLSLCELLELYRKLKPNRCSAQVNKFINAVHGYIPFHLAQSL